MTLTFDGDIYDSFWKFYLYYEELGCYFEITHSNEADYIVRFPAYTIDKGFREYILNTDISIFWKDNKVIIKNAIEQIKEIGQRNLLPQHSNVIEDLLYLVFENNANLKVKE